MFHQATRLTGSALLAGALIAGSGGLLFLDHGAAHAATAHARTARAHPATARLRRALRLRSQVLTVTSLNGTTIAATAPGGQAFTVTTSSTTTFSEAGNTVSLSAVQPKEHILVQGTRDNVTHSIQAKKVAIVVSSVSGVVTNVTGTTITLTGRNAVQHTFTIGSARIEQAGQNTTLQAISVGSLVTVQGTMGDNGALSVLRVLIRLPQLSGTIASVSGTSFTLHTRSGKTYTITPATSATYLVRARGVKPATTTRPVLTVGERVHAVGSLSADGTTLTAVRITIAPAVAKGPATSTTTATTSA